MYPLGVLLVVLDEGPDADEGGADLGYPRADVGDRLDRVDAPAASETIGGGRARHPGRVEDPSEGQWLLAIDQGLEVERLDAGFIAVPCAPEGSCSIPVTCPTMRAPS